MTEEKELIKPELNMFVSWLACPGSIFSFGHTRIRGISPCQQFVLLDWIRHPVFIGDLAESDRPKLAYPDRGNEWGENGVDQSTGENLADWMAQRSD